MSRCCVLLAEGFEEIEAVTVVDVLRRAQVEVKTLALGGRQVTGAHGLSLQADATLEEGARQAWDLVVLPGGLPGATNLRDDPRVLALLKRQHERQHKLAAICAAPIALAAAGVLGGRQATSYPGFGDQLPGARYQEQRVVVDGHITTSRGPGTSLEFALELVRQLCGEQQAEALRRGMLAAPVPQPV